MKNFIAALSLALLASTSAQAATAYLVNCRSATSVTGHYMYVGTYNYNGQYFTRGFDSWCPQSIEIY